MSPTHAPIQISSLLKSCLIFFAIQAVIVIVLFSSIWYSAVSYRVLMLSINVGLSIFFGWRLYRLRYHLVFSYDQNGFRLKQGNREEISHKWSEFSKVSLVRTQIGDFSITLENQEPFDIPTSKLKLNPYDFRSEATKLIEATRKKKSG